MSSTSSRFAVGAARRGELLAQLLLYRDRDGSPFLRIRQKCLRSIFARRAASEMLPALRNMLVT